MLQECGQVVTGLGPWETTGAELRPLSTFASIHGREESLYLDGTTIFLGFFVVVVFIYPKNSIVQVKKT